MIPELGHFALILALCVAVLLGTLPLLGAQQGRREWMVLARPAAQVFFLLVAASMAALAWSFYVSDFSVAYVAGHSNSLLPTMYRLAAVWGGHEGSLLLWVFMLAGWTVAVAQRSRTLDEAMVARVLGVLGLVATGLLLFVLLTSNPVRPAAAGAGGRARPQPAAAGSRPHLPSAPAVHGLRGLFRRVRVRHRGTAVRPPRRGVGALVAAMDHHGLDLPHARASGWAPGGPTTNWAGAAGGSGTRWRTPPSCPG